jgi:elongation factor G
MEGYESQLKSVTGGQGSYTMEFSHYEAVPGDIQQRLAAAHQQPQSQG